MKTPFLEKIDNYFVSPSIQLSPAPSQHLLHLYADYVELVSVFSNQNYVTTSDILDRLKDEGIIKQESNSSDQAEANDERERFVDSIYQVLADRAILFGKDYPFLMDSQDRLILRSSEDINDRQKIYVALLLSSSLNLFNDFQPEITSEFEIVCMHALKNFLPEHAIVKSFGKNSDYKGTAVEKMKTLASDLNVLIDHDAFEEVSKRGTQERGLDLVGWISFEDRISNILSVFCQCACGKEWYKKLNETIRYNNYFRFYRLTPVHSMFIPYSVINYTKGNFFQNDEFSDRLLFDRKRILNFISDLSFFQNLNSKVLVDKCIEFQEEIV